MVPETLSLPWHRLQRQRRRSVALARLPHLRGQSVTLPRHGAETGTRTEGSTASIPSGDASWSCTWTRPGARGAHVIIAGGVRPGPLRPGFGHDRLCAIFPAAPTCGRTISNLNAGAAWAQSWSGFMRAHRHRTWRTQLGKRHAYRGINHRPGIASSAPVHHGRPRRATATNCADERKRTWQTSGDVP